MKAVPRIYAFLQTAVVLFALLLLLPVNAGAWENWSGGYLVAQAGDLKTQAAEALNAKDFDRAIDLLEQAQDEDQFDDSVKDMLGKAYCARGWYKVSKEAFDDGLDDFRKANAIQKNKEYETYLGLGYSSFRLKKYDDALYYLYDAVYIDDDDPNGHEIIGSIYYQRGKLEDAIKEWETALSLKPGNKDVEQMLAKARKEFQVEGKFNKTETYYFNIKYEGDERRDLGDMVLDILNRAYSDVGGDLDYYPNEPVTVILYTKQQFSDITDAPAWSGGVFDGSIRLPIGGVVDKDTLAAVLYHEYAHAVVAMIAGKGVPTWLNEGIAQYEERWVRERQVSLDQAHAVPLNSLEGSFVGISDPHRAKAAYDESLSAVRFMVDRFGSYSLSQIVRLVGEGKPLPDALHECTGLTYSDFVRYWMASLSG